LEFVGAYSQLSEYFMEERRSNLTAAMDRYRDCASILMDPALMTSCLTAPFKTKPQGGATELLGAR
jgi:hypothetical protein